MENSELTNLLNELSITKDFSLCKKIGVVLKEYSMADKWMPTVVSNKTGSILTHRNPDNGKEFIPIFSDDYLIKTKGNGLVIISINKIIKPLLQNPKLGGIEINPFTHGLCIETGTLLEYILGERKSYDLENKNWGKGIPEYTNDDILDDRSILDFGTEVFWNYCNSNQIKPLFCSNDLNACPNVLIKKDGELAFVMVKASIAPNYPRLEFDERKLLIKRAKQFGFKCYFAPVGFGSSDEERFDKSLALRGDGYLAKFEGMKEVEE